MFTELDTHHIYSNPSRRHSWFFNSMRPLVVGMRFSCEWLQKNSYLNWDRFIFSFKKSGWIHFGIGMAQASAILLPHYVLLLFSKVTLWSRMVTRVLCIPVNRKDERIQRIEHLFHLRTFPTAVHKFLQERLGKIVFCFFSSKPVPS